MNRSIFRDQLIDLRGAIYNPGQQVEMNVNGQWRPAQIQNLESYTVRNFFTRENTNRPPNQVFPEGGNPNSNGENTNLIPGRSVLFQGPDPETRVPGTIVSKNYIVQIDGRTETVPHGRLKRATAAQPQATAQPQEAERLANEEFYRQMREMREQAANQNVPPRAAALPAGPAFEVHTAFNEFKANKWDKFMEIINRTTGTNTNFRNRNAPLQPLIDYVNTSESFTPEKKADIIQKINRIFTKIQEYSNYNQNIDNITNCIQYVLMQSPDFIDPYINTFVVDCFKAYNRGNEESCVLGMYERIYLAFRDTASTLCLDQIQGVSAASSLCKPEYIEIYDCFYETLPQELLNDFSSEWYKERGGFDALEKLTPEARIEDFVEFVRRRMNDAVRFYKAEASIRKYANKFINTAFGGRRSSRNKRSVRKTIKKRSNSKKRKTNKRRNSKKMNKRRKTRRY